MPDDSPEKHSLDPWRGQYADRAANMIASEVRALFAVASRPEVVSLAGGMPNVSALPMDTVSSVMTDLIAQHGPVALQYSSAQGIASLRESICEVMALEGISARPDDVVVTCGSQQALDLVAKVFLNPGDTVVTEAPTYVTAINTFAAYQARIVHVEMDEHGVIPDALDAAFTHLRAEGRPVKLFYSVPTFQNPAGVTLTAGRRQQVLEVCRRARVLLVEDNPYGLLRYDGEPVRALRADAPSEHDVIYLGSFSKTLAPGLRVGWALASPAVRDKLVLAAESAVLSQSPLTQMVVDRYLRTQPWTDQLKAFREMYRERRDAMLDALTEHMPPGATWTVPEGGFFVWATLPGGLDAKAMLPRATTARVAYVPGSGFFADGQGQGSMRLSFCYPTPERIREGVQRLSAVINDEIALRTTFGVTHARPAHGPQAPSPELP
ncbi:PLP-dependent aminotransferase family protein [Streptomyces cinnamoneus]|uniref:aminotransferase-like domain-containing protein n=1 Tax=Streptomyces cinnamoneus TaxID=53446 RepID=UPI003403C386